jgi:phenylacetate-CoA ligase
MITLHPNIATFLYSIGRTGIAKCLDELDRHQWLSQDDVQKVQHRQLHALLEYANAFVPYYQDLFKQVGFHPSDFSLDPTTFQRIPLLTKQTIRQNYDRLITTEESRRSTLRQARTGGTTGEPMWFKQDQSYRDFNSAYVYHNMSWSGWQLGEPQSWLWGHVPHQAPFRSGSIATQVRNGIVNRFEIDGFAVTDHNLELLTRHLVKHPGGVLWCYVSPAYRYAQFVQQRGYQVQLRAMCTTAEPLFDFQRQCIERAFGCPVFNNYSSIDTGSIARECDQHRGLHVSTRNCYVEMLRDGQSMLPGEAGEIVITSLTNWGQPLIRYNIEDWGKPSDRVCPCGRGEPLIEVVEGRTIDLFKMRDGRVVYAGFLNDLIPTLEQVKQFQIVQKSLDLVVFRLVVESVIGKDDLAQLEQVSKAALGSQVEIQFEFVDSLPSTAAGKHRYLVSEVR